jgi:hypothetical protein
MSATDLIYDAVVIGLGGHGSAIASALATSVEDKKLRILGIEQFQRVHQCGSSHGGSRIIRLAYFEDERCKCNACSPDPYLLLTTDTHRYQTDLPLLRCTTAAEESSVMARTRFRV